VNGHEAVTAFGVFARHPVLDDVADADHLFGEPRHHALAGLQEPLAELAPFWTVIVGRMVRADDAEAEKARKRREEARPDGVQVDNVRVQEQSGVKDRQRCVDQRFESLALRRPQRHHADLAVRAGLGIAAAADDGDVELVVKLGEARVEVLAMGLDTPHHIRNASQADGADFHELVSNGPAGGSPRIWA